MSAGEAIVNATAVAGFVADKKSGTEPLVHPSALDPSFPITVQANTLA